MKAAPTLTAGTRASRLALWQTDHVLEALATAWPGLQCQAQRFSTRGDEILDRSLPEVGGKGLFTAELEAALRDGTIDLAVHSLKDLPTADAPGLTLGAITQRANVRDVLVAREGWTLDTLPEGAIVGTSSNRRAAQLRQRRPDLDIRSIRGNVETRVRKVHEGHYHASLLAAAGLERLGLTDVITQYLGFDVMLPAAGQGALGIQCRAGDEATLRLLAALDSPAARRATTAERTFLEALGGGCSTPIGAYAETDDEGPIRLRALVAALDGQTVLRLEGEGDDAQALGQTLARQALDQGALDLIAA